MAAIEAPRPRVDVASLERRLEDALSAVRAASAAASARARDEDAHAAALEAVRAAIRAESAQHGFGGLSLDEALKSAPVRRPRVGPGAAVSTDAEWDAAGAASPSQRPMRPTEVAAAEAAVVWGGGLSDVLRAGAEVAHTRRRQEQQQRDAESYAPVRRRNAADEHAATWGDAPRAGGRWPRRRQAGGGFGGAASMGRSNAHSHSFDEGFGDTYVDPRNPGREQRPFVGAFTNRVANGVQHGGAGGSTGGGGSAHHSMSSVPPERTHGEERARAALRFARSAVRRLPLVIVEAGAEELPECSICLEEASVGSELKQLNCKHAFHGPCLMKWFAHGGMKCPMCRQVCIV